MKEWFSVAELRGAGLATLSDGFLDALEREFDTLPADQARTVVQAGRRMREFHASLLLKSEQLALEELFCHGAFARLARLGIHRSVADPRAVYVGPEAARKIGALEVMLRRRNAPADQVSGEP